MSSFNTIWRSLLIGGNVNREVDRWMPTFEKLISNPSPDEHSIELAKHFSLALNTEEKFWIELIKYTDQQVHAKRALDNGAHQLVMEYDRQKPLANTTHTAYQLGLSMGYSKVKNLRKKALRNWIEIVDGIKYLVEESGDLWLEHLRSCSGCSQLINPASVRCRFCKKELLNIDERRSKEPRKLEIASGADLANLHFPGGDFSRKILNNVNFDNGNLEGANFQRADLRNSTFRNTKLDGVDFSDADLEGAVLTQATLLNTNFDNTNLSRADLTHAMFANLAQEFLRNTTMPDGTVTE
jgi:Pentapeptide repeats (9 copies)/Pentapeptide repeats (8 copies)